MLNRRVLLVAALGALVGLNVGFRAFAEDECVSKATTDNGQFTVELLKVSDVGDLVTFEYEICNTSTLGGKDNPALSHWVLGLDIKCFGVDDNGVPYTLDDLVVGATFDGVELAERKVFVGLDPTTGVTGVKFDNGHADRECHTYTVTFDTSVLQTGYTLCAGTVKVATKAGSTVNGYADVCGPVCCLIEECWTDETAWADGLRYQYPGNWATYTAYVSNTTVTLYAGQTLEAGTVHFLAAVDGMVTITIVLNDGFRFALEIEGDDDDDVDNNVKIQDYNEAPSGNPNPGGFDHKEFASPFVETFSIDVPENIFYGVHVDVEQLVDCPDETDESEED